MARWDSIHQARPRRTSNLAAAPRRLPAPNTPTASAPGAATRIGRDPWQGPRMPACAHCGAAFEPQEGLFCRWCGRAGELAVPRLAEAVAIETTGDVASPIVPYGAALPTSFSEVFTTAEPRHVKHRRAIRPAAVSRDM